jgi:gamma-glutamyl-gamma-aminobutyrate hydrolase PuuD/uncharacterized protein YjbI with pentapeptide repeats
VSIQLDPNQRPNPVWANVSFLKPENVKRAAEIAIPFLSFHQGASQLLAVGSAIGQSWEILTNHEEENTSKRLGKLAIVVVSVAMTVFYPGVGLAVTYSYVVAVDVYGLAKHLSSGEYREAGKRGLKLLSTAVYLGSIIYQAPALIAASLLIQGLHEFYRSYQEYQKGKRSPECIANLCLGLIRLYMAKAHISRAYREVFGKKLTQEAWDEMIQTIKKEAAKPNKKSEEKVLSQNKNPLSDQSHCTEEISQQQKQKSLSQRGWEAIETRLFDFWATWFGKADLEQYLIEGNYSSKIQHIHLTETEALNIVSIRNIRFEECDFSEGEFRESSLENVQFNRCLLRQARFIETYIRNCRIIGSDLTEAVFYRIRAHNFTILHSDLSSACFNDSLLKKVRIISSTLFGASFLGARPSNSSIEQCDLTDVLLADAKEHFQYRNCLEHRITRPVIAIGWNFYDSGHWGECPHHALKEQGVLSLRYDNYPYEDIDVDSLDQEVELGLRNLSEGAGSIAKRLLNSGIQGEQMKRIKQKAATILQHSDGVILPGGEDVEEEFYLPLRHISFFQGDYLRSIQEYTLIDECFKRKQPLWGICRGSQIINTYFGGTLKDVDDQCRQIQRLELQPNRAGELFRREIGAEIWGVSMHYQAADKVGEGLEIALKADGVVKAMVSKDETFLMTQFHPENYFHAKEIFEEALKGNIRPLIRYALMSQEHRDHFFERGLHILPFSFDEEGRCHLTNSDYIVSFENWLQEGGQLMKKILENKRVFDYFLGHVQTFRAQNIPAA